jgi:hypothetical protein
MPDFNGMIDFLTSFISLMEQFGSMTGTALEDGQGWTIVLQRFARHRDARKENFAWPPVDKVSRKKTHS